MAVDHGDGRSIENPAEQPSPTDPSDVPVEGEESDDVGSEGETVADSGDGLVTEEGVNERG